MNLTPIKYAVACVAGLFVASQLNFCEEVSGQPLRMVQPAQVITPPKPAILHLLDIHGRDHYIPVGMVQGVQGAFQEDGQEYSRVVVDGSGWAPVITVRASPEEIAKTWADLTGQAVHAVTIGK